MLDIPMDWDCLPISQIISTPVSDGPHETPEFLVSGIPFLSVNNIVDNRLSFDDLRYVSEEDHARFSLKCKPQFHDILMGKAASVGKVAIVETDIEFNIWSPLALIRVNRSICPHYVYYSLQSLYVLEQIKRLTNTSSQGNLGMGLIEELIVPIPPVFEQKAIATILMKVDELIQDIEIEINKLTLFKQGLVNDLMTRGVDMDGKIRKEHSTIPEGWEKVSISSVGRVVPGGTPSRKVDQFWGGDIVWITPQEVTSDEMRTISTSLERITEAGLRSSSARLIQKNSVLITSRASIGYVAMNDIEVTTNQGFQSLVTNSDNDSVFFLYFIPWIRNKILQYSQGSTFLEISGRMLAQLEIIIPKLDEQVRIASILSSLDAHIEDEKRILQNQNHIRDGLMEDLLTGRIRVSEVMEGDT